MHAHSLEFIHPVSKEKIKVEAEYPRDFAAMVQILNKYNKIYQ
jgi:hypothetical protein